MAEGERDRQKLVLRVLLALMVAKRLAYHLTYIVVDPFALATFSDGQVYEDAARDILAHPPLGTQPFYLQGLYAYLLALPMALTPEVVLGLVLQLALAAAALYLFHRAATAEFGPLAGSLSSLCLLAFTELASYENKYLSVSLGVSCNVAALWAAQRALANARPGALGAGACAGLAALGRPNMALAWPFTLWAFFRARLGARAALGFGLGIALALAPMALRNALVVGRPEIFPSHAGAIPFYIGNNPDANGRWNTAGGLLTGQVGNERAELAGRLGLRARDPADLDRAIAAELLGRSFDYIRSRPLDWLALEAKKLWYTTGNHRFVRDYDARGEAELVGSFHSFGLPFGIVLGLGAIGFGVIARRAREAPEERAHWLALLGVLGGQISAVSAANLLVFASAQNRVPLCIPLAFVAGPALIALHSALRGNAASPFRAGTLALALGIGLSMQAFWPRIHEPAQPSSFHYYNLAAVEEAIGRDAAAAAHYGRAVQRNPRQPMFQLRYAQALRRTQRPGEALAVLDRLAVLPDVPPEIKREAADERRAIMASAPAP